MANLGDDETKDVALHDNASTSTTPLPVTTTLDGSKRRLDVDASITQSVNPTGDKFHVEDTTSNPLSVPFTGATHTVNTGKKFLLFGWRVNTQGAIYEAELQRDGTKVDRTRQDNSAFTSVATGTVNYAPIPLEFAAAEVIRIQIIALRNNFCNRSTRSSSVSL